MSITLGPGTIKAIKNVCDALAHDDAFGNSAVKEAAANYSEKVLEAIRGVFTFGLAKAREEKTRQDTYLSKAHEAFDRLVAMGGSMGGGNRTSLATLVLIQSLPKAEIPKADIDELKAALEASDAFRVSGSEVQRLKGPDGTLIPLPILSPAQKAHQTRKLGSEPGNEPARGPLVNIIKGHLGLDTLTGDQQRKLVIALRSLGKTSSAASSEDWKQAWIKVRSG